MHKLNPLLEFDKRNIGYSLAGSVPGFIAGSIGGGAVGEKIRNYLDKKDIKNYKKKLQNREFFKKEADEAINSLKKRIEYYKNFGSGTYEISAKKMIERDKSLIQDVIRMYQTNDIDGFYNSFGQYGDYTNSGKILYNNQMKHLKLSNRIATGSTIAGTAIGSIAAPTIMKKIH